MIEVRALSKHFGNTVAVDQVSFRVEQGERLVLLGTSGCGKTTTLRMINRLTEPSSGQVLIRGKDIGQERPERLRRSIGYVLQHYGLFPHYTVSENISIVPKLLGWAPGKIRDRVDQLISQLHLPEDSHSKHPKELSGGQQQRVGLARALAADPPILLMDEPFGALDPVTRVSLRKEFLRLEELRSKTTIMVTHDVQEAFELGDRICLMRGGKIIQIGTPAELLHHPSDEFVTAFLSGQRSSLDMQLTTMADIWQWLPSGSSTIISQEPLSTQTTIQAGLELLSGEYNTLVIESDSLERRAVSMGDILTAYGQYKNSHHYD